MDKIKDDKDLGDGTGIGGSAKTGPAGDTENMPNGGGTSKIDVTFNKDQCSGSGRGT